MSRRKIIPALLAAGLLAGGTQTVQAASYEVSLTNATRGLLFTPRLVVTHSAGQAFALGQPALSELAALAEGGATQPFEDLLEGFGEIVGSVQTSDAILEAGASETITVTTDDASTKLTLLAMILPSNDGFVALNGVDLPAQGSLSYDVLVYDAGTETNDESCDHIPGPQCGGEADSPEDSGEGYVYVHGGIHGIGDLSSASYDWRNPAARVTITRTD